MIFFCSVLAGWGRARLPFPDQRESAPPNEISAQEMSFTFSFHPSPVSVGFSPLSFYLDSDILNTVSLWFLFCCHIAYMFLSFTHFLVISCAWQSLQHRAVTVFISPPYSASISCNPWSFGGLL